MKYSERNAQTRKKFSEYLFPSIDTIRSRDGPTTFDLIDEILSELREQKETKKESFVARSK
jgi:hypothetical protein